MKTTQEERDKWRKSLPARVDALMNEKAFRRLLDDADELARLREGLRKSERVDAHPCHGGDLEIAPESDGDFVRWSDLAALLGDE
jgi:hypothetical protein